MYLSRIIVEFCILLFDDIILPNACNTIIPLSFIFEIMMSILLDTVTRTKRYYLLDNKKPLLE